MPMVKLTEIVSPFLDFSSNLFRMVLICFPLSSKDVIEASVNVFFIVSNGAPLIEIFDNLLFGTNVFSASDYENLPGIILEDLDLLISTLI